MKDLNDTFTTDMFELPLAKRTAGRPALYGTDAERKSARAKAARERRARERDAGWVEVRRLVKHKEQPLQSDVIDLSAIPAHRRK